MPADEAALLAGIRERLESALESLKERPPLEERPFLATAHRALAVLVHHLRSHCSRSILALWRRRGSSRRSSCSPNRSSRDAGTTSPPTCRMRRNRCCIPAPASRSAPTISRRSSRWSSSDRRSARTLRSRSRRRSSTSTPSGGPPRSTGRGGSSRRSGRARGSSTSTRASARPAATSRTPRSRRRTTTPRRAGRGSRPRPAPASGARRSPSRARSSGSSARSTWSGSRTTRSRSGVR